MICSVNVVRSVNTRNSCQFEKVCQVLHFLVITVKFIIYVKFAIPVIPVKTVTLCNYLSAQSIIVSSVSNCQLSQPFYERVNSKLMPIYCICTVIVSSIFGWLFLYTLKLYICIEYLRVKSVAVGPEKTAFQYQILIGWMLCIVHWGHCLECGVM